MTVCTVLEYPHPKLREMSVSVSNETLSQENLAKLINDLKETLYAKAGTVGLAAPQIGYNFRVFVMDATANSDKSRYKLIINPEILSSSRWKYGREGCLSFPDYLITLKRARKLEVQYYDASMTLQMESLEDFESVIFQHELDHLNGVLFIDLAKNLEVDLIKRNS